MELGNKDPTAEPVSLPLGFLRSVTDDFCNKRKLGEGAYGVVYKGILPCGSVLAVKKFHERILICDNDRSFMDEASFLMDIEHQNIVQLLGFCAESSGAMMTKLPNGKVIVVDQLTRMLCFEYMSKGGLDKHLSDESSGLEWNTRYKIIKGICHGLNFLHGCNIIHLDLKPGNILMDATMTPKIADFGLSRLLGEQKSYTVASTSNRPGTPGYMAREYIDRGIISKKADIFSLGVIIIEIVTGSKDDYPDYGQSNEAFQHFTDKVLSKWRNRIFEGSSKYTSPELHTQLVKQCIDIALGCVHPVKEKRPDVSNIIEILNATEESCYDQNGKDLLVDRQMGNQEGLPTSGVLHEDGLVALNKSALKDHAKAWITKDMMKSASVELGDNVKALQRELLSVQAVFESILYKEITNSVLKQLLEKLQDLGYDADDVLDEMDYFRIQDTLDGTFHAADQHDRGWVHNLALNVHHTAEATAGKLNFLPASSRACGDTIIHAVGKCFPCSPLHDDDEENSDNSMHHNSSERYHTNEPPKLAFDRVGASKKIKRIVEEMQELRKQISEIISVLPLGSPWVTVPNSAQGHRISTSGSIEPRLYGRDLMINTIIDDIITGKYSSEVLTVIPIVGPGGIGKTALAQHIYHSEKLQQHFDLRVWICVSLNFDVNKLIEEIQKYIPKVTDESSNGTASELIGQRLIKGRKLLLVLDDIWDCSSEVQWNQLLLPFKKSQEQGNIILATTRVPKQAQIMTEKADHSIYLKGLECAEFEKLFLDIVFGDDDQSRDDYKFLFAIGSKIAGKLKGSPLAAKTVGSLLKTQLNSNDWTRVLESKEWEQSNGEDDIMPALKLSFDYLPSHQLKQCFTYCALFPQDYKFKEEDLINFLIGQEVVCGENKTVEDIVRNHLTKLVDYGFLERKQEKGESTCYNIHDLLHDLACKVSSHECLVINSSQSHVRSLQVPPSIRHLSINIEDTSVNGRLVLKNCVDDFNTFLKRIKVEKLRTLMLFGEHHGCFVKVFGDLFREAKALRVIFLSKASYDVEYLLCNFYSLLHLRYLQIESSSLYKARFPNKLSRFYHMMVIDAKHCDIIDLPRDISNLAKLRHLLVQNDITHSSIVDVGKLKSLQELRRFMVKQKDQGFELWQIGDLINLCKLSIYNLQNVQVKEEADEAKLFAKRHLHELTLHWDNIDRSIDDSTLEECVLERLRPSTNLLKLSVKGHSGATCPSWLGTDLSVKNLESLCLKGVAWKKFPPIGDLWLPHEENISGSIPDRRFGNLRRLKLCELIMVEKWVVHAPCQLFPFLEVLIIKDCPQLVDLSFQHFSCCQQAKEVNLCLFPRLEKLVIRNCPQLSSFPPIPWNKAPCSINIKEVGCLYKLDCGKPFKSEYGLTINTINGWNLLNFHNLTELKELQMNNGESPPLCYLQMLSSLRILQMSCSSNVFPFTEADNHVKYKFPVQELFISQWNASGKELTQLLIYFPKLSDLQLWHCEKQVTGLAVNVRGQRATETPRLSSSSTNKVSQQQDPRAEDEIIASEAEHGMLLLPPGLQRLAICWSPKLRLCSKPHDDNNEDGQNGGGRGGGLQALTSLRQLEIMRCPKLLSNYSSSSFSSYFPFPNSLEHLEINGAMVPLSNLTSLTSLSISSIDKMVTLSNLTSLTSLTIWNCGDLRGEGLLPLLTQGHLTDLAVIKTPNFFVDFDPSNVHAQEIPSCSSKLQKLTIADVAGFTAAAIRCSQITKLVIVEDNKVECFTEEQEALLFINSLEDVTFYLCDNLQSLPKRLHGLHNLKRLGIWSCPKIQSLSKDCLPDSLQILDIKIYPAIRSLPEVDDLPSSLREIDVQSCENEELSIQCRKLINIIPIVRF